MHTLRLLLHQKDTVSCSSGSAKPVKTSVAEPELEPVEQQLFAGAGTKVFWPGSGAGYINF
jgi:hypothetical protein